MKPTTKPEHPEGAPRAAAPVYLFTDWVQQGTESFFAAQRILLDLVMRQNSIALNTLRDRFAARPGPVATVSEIAGEGMSNFIAAQKILLDLAERQNEIVMNGVKERVGFSKLRKVAGTVWTFIRLAKTMGVGDRGSSHYEVWKRLDG